MSGKSSKDRSQLAKGIISAMPQVIDESICNMTSNMFTKAEQEKEITRTQGGVRLDLNLEKGRLREESSGQELKIKEVEYKIEQEIASLRTNIQASKYLVGLGFFLMEGPVKPY
ncbi:hypothetical protein MPER_01299, partial [Moniliophthora perniciosa FA553]